MQVGQLSSLLATFATALEASGASQASNALQKFARALALAGSITTQKLVAKVDNAGLSASAAAEPTLGTLDPQLRGLVAVLQQAAAKQQLVADVQLLLDLTRRHSEVSFTAFESWAIRSVASASHRKADSGATSVDPKQLVEAYLERLQSALGNDAAFSALYRELSGDKRVTRTEAIEIASRFFEPMPQSTTRPKALQKILYRHQKLMETRAAASSIGGKAA